MENKESAFNRMGWNEPAVRGVFYLLIIVEVQLILCCKSGGIL